MSETFSACTLPWSIWPWGLDLTHSDTDTSPECSVEFGVLIVRPSPPYEGRWVRVEFEGAWYASAKPHGDDESVFDVTDYEMVPRRSGNAFDAYQEEQDEWLRTGVCPDPGFYFSTSTTWLEAERHRGFLPPQEAVHFLLDGRDGYIEILATGFTWRAWHEGRPLLSAKSGDPIAGGEWSPPQASDR